MNKPFSQACENNKKPILEVITPYFQGGGSVLEIGSGTGQHGVFFASHLPNLQWHTSDRVENHEGIGLWISEAGLSNLHLPVTLDVRAGQWPLAEFDGVFSANTAHIMSWPEVVAMFEGVGRVLSSGGFFCLYGPFNDHGRFTSDSNARFDQHLKARASHMGIRNFEAVDELANENCLKLVKDHAMPANNRTLVW
ncbi:MAG: DUF938 domain-containing protein, partial [Endozoicomonas sp.]